MCTIGARVQKREISRLDLILMTVRHTRDRHSPSIKLGAREVAMAGEELLTLVTEGTFIIELLFVSVRGYGAGLKNSVNSGIQST